MVNTSKKSLFFIEDRVVCGIDEAGRGPIAGPLVVAGVVLEAKISGLRDSKKLSAKRREELFEEIISSSIYHIVTIDSSDIDRFGLSKSMKKALLEIKSKIVEQVETEIEFIFDGNSPFGVDGLHTIVKADQKIDEVSAGSILAKVTRDRVMVEYSKEYQEYGFAKHKGYCTKAHLEAISKYGLCKIHRKSFKIPSTFGNKTLFD